MTILRMARVLATILLPARNREFILGDLEELHGKWRREEGSRTADWRYVRLLVASVATQLLWVLRLVRAENRRARPPTRRRGSGLLPDFREAARMIRRRPVFVLLVSSTLGVGVGSAGAVFGLLRELVLRPLPGVEAPDAAAFVVFGWREAPHVGTGVSGPVVEELRRSATLLSGLATYDYVGVHVSVPGSRPIEARAETIYGDYFEVLGVRPAVGRLLSAVETGPHADAMVAVISERLWADLFGRSRDVVGGRLRANDQLLTVIGVAAGGFLGTDRSFPKDLWVPRSAFVPLARFPRERLWSPNSTLNQDFVLRPRAGVSFAAAEDQLNQILQRLEAQPEHEQALDGVSASVHAGLHVAPALRPVVYSAVAVMGGAMVLLLLIPCANVANLLVVDAVRRRGEIAVRRAMGASPARVMRQRFIESALLGVGAMIPGLAIAWLIVSVFRGASIAGTPVFDGFVPDQSVLFFAVASVLVTTLVFGTLPAFFAARFDLPGALRDADAHLSDRHAGFRRGMSIVQIAVSLTLLVGAILLTRTMHNLHAVDTGTDIEGVYILTLDLGSNVPEGPALEALNVRLLEAVTRIPNVESAALHSWYGPYAGRPGGRIAVTNGHTPEPAQAAMHWGSPG